MSPVSHLLYLRHREKQLKEEDTFSSASSTSLVLAEMISKSPGDGDRQTGPFFEAPIFTRPAGVLWDSGQAPALLPGLPQLGAGLRPPGQQGWRLGSGYQHLPGIL